MSQRIDLNADMGESFGRWTLGDDEALMPFLTLTVAYSFLAAAHFVLPRPPLLEAQS